MVDIRTFVKWQSEALKSLECQMALNGTKCVKF